MIGDNLNIFNHISDTLNIKQEPITQYKYGFEMWDDKDRYVEEIENIISIIEQLDIDQSTRKICNNQNFMQFLKKRVHLLMLESSYNHNQNKSQLAKNFQKYLVDACKIIMNYVSDC